MDLSTVKSPEIEKTSTNDTKSVVDKWYLDKVNENDSLRHSLRKIALKMFKELNECIDHTLEIDVFKRVHDLFIPSIKIVFREMDYELFAKCKTLAHFNVFPEQLGADEDYAIRLTAAFVELAMLESYKSPIEKMDCLQTAYDLVFAELKTAMISVMCKTSEKDYEILTVNNDDVIPLLMVVIIKSKLEHLISNLFYIQKCLYHLPRSHNEKDYPMILSSFQKAVDNLKLFKVMSLEASSERIKDSLELSEYMLLSSNEVQTQSTTLIDEDRERFLNLISISTSNEEQNVGFREY